MVDNNRTINLIFNDSPVKSAHVHVLRSKVKMTHRKSSSKDCSGTDYKLELLGHFLRLRHNHLHSIRKFTSTSPAEYRFFRVSCSAILTINALERHRGYLCFLFKMVREKQCSLRHQKQSHRARLPYSAILNCACYQTTT